MTGRTPLGKRVRALSGMDYDEVSLVDVPANQHAAVMIAKRHQGADMPDYEGRIFDDAGTEIAIDDLENGQVVYGEDGEAYRWTAADDDAAAADAELAGAGAVAKRDNNPLLGLGARQYVAKSAVDAPNLAAEISKALGAAQSDAERDAVIKNFAGVVDQLAARQVEIEKRAEHERDLRLEAQYVEVAKNLALPAVTAEEFGPVLKRCADVLDDADLEILAKALDATSGVLYEELGYAGVGVEAGDPYIADAEAAAEQHIAKAAGAEPISKAAAISMYYEQNGDAYDQYLASRQL